MEDDSRYFTDMDDERLKALLGLIPELELKEIWQTTGLNIKLTLRVY